MTGTMTATGGGVLLRICAWVLYSLGFLIGTGGVMAAMDIARTPDQYGITP